MKSTEAKTHYFGSLEEASRALCLEIIREAATAAADYGDFRLVLAGGSTPSRLYEMLAAEADNPDIAWKAFHFFWGDERFLPPYDANSNYCLAAKKLLSKIPLTPENVHQVPVQGNTPREAAGKYDGILRKFETNGRPLFDLALLGMGEDGHTASLFPGHPVLDEAVSLAAAVEESAGSPPVPRITMTLKGLARSSRICFLTAGIRKRRIIDRIRAGGWEGIYPAARVRALDRVDWFAA